MKRIEGLVCVGSTSGINVLFGKSVDNDPRIYENLQTNGILPYESIDEAEKGAEQIRDLDEIDDVVIKEIKMEVAENEEDFNDLMVSDSLIVIMYREDGEGFFGPIDKYPS